MSKFEDNPFGEPELDNPFADPIAPQQAVNRTVIASANAATAASSNNAILDEYNPFDDDDNNRKRSQYTDGSTNILGQSQNTAPPQIPAYNQNTQQQQQAYGTGNATSSTQISTAELQRRQEELERKAAELERREAELRNNANGGVRRNNWPPLPEKCCFQPCFYQDIGVEIPSEFQKIVRHLYYLWMFYALVMCVNIFGALILMFHANEYSFFGLSIIYAFMFTPASFLCWYRPAYKAFRSDSSFNFMVFFFIFFFQMILLIIQTIGIPGSGYCGFITALSQFDGKPSGIIVGLFLLMIAIAFATCTAGNVMLITKIHSIYRHSDTVSLSKAQDEFTSGIVRNQHVRQAAANATTAAFTSSMSSPPANRY